MDDAANKSTNKVASWVVGVGALVLVLAIARCVEQTVPSTEHGTPPTSNTVSEVDPADKVQILSNHAYKGGFGDVMILTLKLKNKNAFAVKDFQIVCANYAASGTELAASFGALFEKLMPGQTKTFRNVNLGLMPPGSKTYSCKIAVVTPVGRN